MEISKVIKPELITERQPDKRVLPADELKRLTDFFSLLIQVDKKNKARKGVLKNANPKANRE